MRGLSYRLRAESCVLHILAIKHSQTKTKKKAILPKWLLTCDDQSPSAIRPPFIIVSEARVDASVTPCNVTDLQAAIFPNEDSMGRNTSFTEFM